jgi:hypothetical protein
MDTPGKVMEDGRPLFKVQKHFLEPMILTQSYHVTLTSQIQLIAAKDPSGSIMEYTCSPWYLIMALYVKCSS